MKFGTHMPDGERRKPIDNEVCRTKVKVTTSKNTHVEQKCYTFFVSARYLKNDRSDLNETWYTHA
jgi:hypothetical protein